jgi:hypothetical protein
MNLATNLFIVFIIYFVLSYVKVLINKDKRVEHAKIMTELEKLRKIPYKSLKEQREFIDLKYPKTDPFVWSFQNIAKFVLKLVLMVAIFFGIKYLWRTHIVFEFALWQVMLIAVIVPILVNKVLKKYNLHNDDLTIFFN